MRKTGFVGTRWLGVGLAAALAVFTISLAVTGRLGLYINPDSTWFAVSMSVFVLIGAVASFALPLGAEADHGHDHGEEPEHDHGHHTSHPLAVAATVAGGVAASGVVVLTLVLPPASLSAELAMSRDVGATPLFGGTDTIQLASTGDTASFGVGEWATVFATATNPDAFDGETVELTGFVTPGEGGEFDLTRLVITHCVIDAQPASLPVVSGASAPDTGQWVTITGTVRSSSDGQLVVAAAAVEEIDEPEDPYEY
ncbi:TIGR03943 family putative permease subunit [Microbacterium sp. PRC9]|uniref:TIGR03943 family putative permease subunit n=1 Tax=Microbacterium sp. PRC9 TaxID=2962591 RepID=UPI00288105A8|nr:TIGR03943 family protein [Microbacterium sp. PRC9]MDT0142661.1 TIGR03943 family protein [Microbacterium sp. PRC9]